MNTSPTVNDRPPNFRAEDGRLFLMRCFACEPERGMENWAPSVATGTCAFCGWHEEPSEDTAMGSDEPAVG